MVSSLTFHSLIPHCKMERLVCFPHKVVGGINSTNTARCWWLMPIILASQEAEIRRIEAQSQPWANSSWDPISKKPITEKGWWSGSRYRPWVQTPALQKKKVIIVNLTQKFINILLWLIYTIPSWTQLWFPYINILPTLLLKNVLVAGRIAQVVSTCLASMRLRVQTPVTLKQKSCRTLSYHRFL
jgi:hypothetical protein